MYIQNKNLFFFSKSICTDPQSSVYMMHLKKKKMFSQLDLVSGLI